MVEINGAVKSIQADERRHADNQRTDRRPVALWAASEDLRMVIAATFEVRPSGAPAIAEITLMPTVGPWLPFRDVDELHNVRVSLRDRCAFLQPLDFLQSARLGGG